MKKVFLVLLCCLSLVGCNKQNHVKDDTLYKQYLEYEKKLDKAKEYEEYTKDFSINLIVNSIDNDKYRYDIIIDTPSINMYHLQAMAKVVDEDNQSLPTLGVLENDIFSLVPGVVDKERGIYKGVNLSGITSKSDFTVLVYLTFSTDVNNEKKEERYIKLYGHAS